MQRAHHLDPALNGGVGSRIADGTRLIVAKPHHAHIVGRIAHKPPVNVVAGRTGLAGHRHVGQLRRRAGARAHNALQQAVDEPGRLLAHGVNGVCLMLEQHRAVVGHHLGVGVGLVVNPLVDKGAVGRGHFQIGDAVRHAAQRKRRRLTSLLTSP